jgi:hypothetical protein
VEVVTADAVTDAGGVGAALAGEVTDVAAVTTEQATANAVAPLRKRRLT